MKKRSTNELIQVIFIVVLFVVEINGQNLDIIRRLRQRNSACGFRCQSGECIDENRECDGISDCTDESDETNACQRIKCPLFSFKCKYGACIDADSICNGKKDCRDNSDEASSRCRKGPNNCSVGQFQCDSGQCIHQNNKCDGTVHCDDDSDETEETCFGLRCPGFSYRCAYGACVDGNSECNGKKECFDGSDEDPSKCHQLMTQRPPPPRPENRGRCILPQQPPFGRISVEGPNTNFNAGDYVDPNTVMVLTCKKRYKLEGKLYAFCKNGGTWSNTLGVCLPLCQSYKNTPEMSVTCILHGQVIDCNEPVAGTIVNLACVDHNANLNHFSHLKCIDGDWVGHPPSCHPGRPPVLINLTININLLQAKYRDEDSILFPNN